MLHSYEKKILTLKSYKLYQDKRKEASRKEGRGEGGRKEA